MSEFQATGNLVIDSIEGADAALEGEFSASDAITADAKSRGGNRSVEKITDNLDETVDLARTRNDLLRDIQQTSEDGSFRISRRITRSFRSLSRASVAATLGSGALVTAALSQSPDVRPQPGETSEPSDQADPNTGESDIVDPVTITAAQVVAEGATVPPGQVITSGATVTAAKVVANEASVGPGDIIDAAVELAAGDVLEGAAKGAVELGTGNIVKAAIELGKSDVLADAASGAAVSLGAGDVVDPAELKAKDVIDANVEADDLLTALVGGGAAGAAGGVAKWLSDLSTTGGGAGATGVGLPMSIIPQTADILNDVTPRDIIPGPDKEDGLGTVSRDTTVEVNNNVETTTSMDRREREDIISEAMREMRRELRRELD
jgi:hypothetical protein